MPAEAPSLAVLIDLSSIAHPIWHMSQSDPDPNRTSIDTVAKVRALASGQPHVAVCCDSGKSFRVEIDSSYKANRPESDATLHHQIALARETLLGDGFPVWAVRGFEADDLIATGARLAQEAGLDVLVVSSDKDLLQLVNGHVKAKSLRDGSILNTEAVREKFGVAPEQMRDYLSLVGDASDNIKGAKGIGPKKAAALLLKHGTLDKLYADIAEIGPQDLGIKPSEALALDEFKVRYPTVRSLIALRGDVEIPFSEITTERVPKEASTFMDEMMEGQMDILVEETLESAGNIDALGVLREANGITPSEAVPETAKADVAPPSTPDAVRAPGPAALAVREPEMLDAVPVEWERQLEPRSMKEAQSLATNLHASRLFSAYGSPAATLVAILAGREIGVQAVASLRAFHVIEGKASPSAELLRALVLKSGKAKFFRCTERTAEKATFETQRGADPALSLSYTMAEATASGRAKAGSGYAKDPADLLVARSSAKLARLVYPDVTLGMVAFEEMGDSDAA